MLRSGTIVIEEDEENDVELFIHAFKKADIHKPVHWARDGDQLIQHLTQLRDQSERMPFLVVIDWKMPKRNALDVIKWIRDQPGYLNLWIAVVTGSHDPSQRQVALESGANWYIEKAVGFPHLTTLVKGLAELDAQAVSPPQL